MERQRRRCSRPRRSPTRRPPAGSRWCSPARSRSTPAPPTWPPTSRRTGTTPRPPRASARRASATRRWTRSRTAPAPTASTRTARAARSRRAASTRPTTTSTSCSDRSPPSRPPPAAPTGVTREPGDQPGAGQLDGAEREGGGPITGYTVTPYIGSTAQTPVKVSASATSATLDGSARTARATRSRSPRQRNAVGTGNASSASNAVTPEDTIFDFATPAIDRRRRHALGRARRQVHRRRERLGDGDPLLQGRHQHRHAHRQPVDRQRARCSPPRPSPTRRHRAGRHVTFSTPGRDHRRAPPMWPATSRPTATTPRPRRLRDRGRHQPAAAGARQRHSASTACTRTAPPSTFPSNSYNATNYWVDVLFAPAPAASPPGAPTGVTAKPASEPGAGQLDARRAQRRQRDHGLHGDAVHRRERADAGPRSAASAPSTIVTGLTNGTPTRSPSPPSNATGTGSAVERLQRGHAATTRSSTSRPRTIDSGDTDLGRARGQVHRDVNGSVTGIRFYKAATNTGTHIGSLWSTGGTLLAAATFTSETASGWQRSTSPNPVAITAGTTYVASYLAPNGHYSATAAAFSPRASTTRRWTRWRTARASTACTRTARPARSPRTATTRRTTRSM